MTTPPPRLTAVVASTYREFADWCLREGLDPRDPSLCLVIHEQHIRGRWFEAVVDLGTRHPFLVEAARERIWPPNEPTEPTA